MTVVHRAAGRPELLAWGREPGTLLARFVRDGCHFAISRTHSIMNFIGKRHPSLTGRSKRIRAHSLQGR